MKPREFDCIGCGVHVFSYGEPAPSSDPADMCVECLWLLNVTDPVERERLRAFLQRDRDEARKANDS